MCSDLIDGGSLFTIIAEHLDDEVLKLSREVLSSSLLPVGFKVVVHNEAIEVLVFLSFLEGKDALHDNEENNRGGEHVDLNTIVILVFLDFRCHVGHGSSVGLQIVDLTEGSETEVSNLEVHEVIYKDVFQL